MVIANTIGRVTSNSSSDDAVLAASARSCPVFRDAVEFAADGVPAMGRPWTFAAGAGLMGPGGGAVGDEDVLQRWLAGVSAVLASETAEGEDGGALLLALSVLGAIKARENGRLRGAFWEVVRVRLQDLCDRAGSRFPFRTRRQYTGQRWGNELPGLVSLMAECGLVASGADVAEPEWTGLGRWAYAALPGAVPWPASPELSPAELVGYLMGFGDDRVREHLAAGWFDRRDPVSAARELLTAADTMTPGRRMFAVWIAHELGDSALPAFEAAAGAWCTGPYARMTLRSAGSLTSAADADLRWLAVEKAAVTLEQDNPDEALTVLWEALGEDDLEATVAATAATGHPDAVTVAKQVSAFLGSGAPRSVEQALELAVTGAGETRYRVQVPAIFTLADLHDALAGLSGRDESDPHVFGAGRNEYRAGEGEIRLSSVLGRVKRITYTCGPESLEITQERRLPQDPERSYPYVVSRAS